jgi:hypothetical protein
MNRGPSIIVCTSLMDVHGYLFLGCVVFSIEKEDELACQVQRKSKTIEM